MAFDGTPTKLLGDAVAGSKVLATRAQAHWGVVWPVLAGAVTWVRRLVSSLPFVRWFSRSLARRIVFSNAVGLVILLGGYLYLNQY